MCGGRVCGGVPAVVYMYVMCYIHVYVMCNVNVYVVGHVNMYVMCNINVYGMCNHAGTCNTPCEMYIHVKCMHNV